MASKNFLKKIGFWKTRFSTLFFTFFSLFFSRGRKSRKTCTQGSPPVFCYYWSNFRKTRFFGFFHIFKISRPIVEEITLICIRLLTFSSENIPSFPVPKCFCQEITLSREICKFVISPTERPTYSPTLNLVVATISYRFSSNGGSQYQNVTKNRTSKPCFLPKKHRFFTKSSKNTPKIAIPA